MTSLRSESSAYASATADDAVVAALVADDVADAEHVFGRWHASLQLAYARQGDATVPVLRKHHGPLRVQKHFHPEGPSLCQHIIVHPPGGIVGGDALRIAVDVGANAHVLLTSPGAAKWYCGDREATLDLHLKIDDGAVLEWLPLETIFYAGSRSRVRNRIELSGSARLLFADVMCLGRPGSNERYADVAGGHWRQHSDVFRDGRLLWCEESFLAADDPLLAAAAGMQGKTVLASVLWFGDALPAELHDACLALSPSRLCGMTQLPAMWQARRLCDSVEEAQHWLRALWALLRPALIGRAAVMPRIWAT